MPTDDEIGFPLGSTDERELLLSWLRDLRGAVLRKVDGPDVGVAPPRQRDGSPCRARRQRA